MQATQEQSLNLSSKTALSTYATAEMAAATWGLTIRYLGKINEGCTNIPHSFYSLISPSECAIKQISKSFCQKIPHFAEKSVRKEAVKNVQHLISQYTPMGNVMNATNGAVQVLIKNSGLVLPFAVPVIGYVADSIATKSPIEQLKNRIKDLSAGFVTRTAMLTFLAAATQSRGVPGAGLLPVQGFLPNEHCTAIEDNNVDPSGHMMIKTYMFVQTANLLSYRTNAGNWATNAFLVALAAAEFAGTVATTAGEFHTVEELNQGIIWGAGIAAASYGAGYIADTIASRIN